MAAHILRSPRRMRQGDHMSRLTCKHSRLVHQKKQMDRAVFLQVSFWEMDRDKINSRMKKRIRINNFKGKKKKTLLGKYSERSP